MNSSQDYGAQIADVYDEWYDSQLPSDQTADFLHSLSPGGTFLELGVGTGRVALRVAQRGGQVTGVDLSESMLRRLAAKDPSGLVHRRLINMTDCSSLGKFSVVYCVFNTLGGLPTWQEQHRTFQSVRESIHNDGYFVLEQRVPEIEDLGMSGQLRVIDVGPDWIRVGSEVVDKLTQRIDIQIMELRSPGSVKFYPASVRYITSEEIFSAAADAGMELLESYLDWAGSKGPGSIHVFRPRRSEE